MNKITIGSIVLYTVLILGSYFYQQYITILTVFVFIILGMGFLTVGILMITLLKNHFPEFYENVNKLLIIATLLLAIPMFMRAINWIGQDTII